MFTDHECSQLDAHREATKYAPDVEDPIEAEPAAKPIVHRCDIGTYSNGVYTDCSYEHGHVGRCSGAGEGR